jgi:hypothetical protein
MESLLHGDTQWLSQSAPITFPPPDAAGITSEAEEQQIEGLNEWMESVGLPRGTSSFDFSDSETGQQKAVFDVAWPNGVQEELSEPIAVLLNEPAETLALASGAGFRCFTSVATFKAYVQSEVLNQKTTA